MDKVTAEHAFLDLSDYGRPLARWLVRLLLATPVSPIHLTLTYTVVGFAAAVLFARNQWLPLAAALLVVKGVLDAADGALARARRRPSRVGRFLDSVCDFAVTVAVFGGIAVAAVQQTGQHLYWALAVLAILFATGQGSVYSYYSVRHREETGGDLTSRVSEAEAGGYPWDDRRALAVLHRLYRVIYGPHDALMDRIDRFLVPSRAPVGRWPWFLTATTVLGLGSQLAVTAACALAGRPAWALWLFPTVFNVYWLLLLLVRKASSDASVSP